MTPQRPSIETAQVWMHAVDRDALETAAARLSEAAHPHDHFGRTVAASRVLGIIPRRQRYRRAGTGWRLGVLAVSTTGELHAVGQIVRASRQVLPGHQAESARERRALKETLVDDGFPDGATVLLDSPRIDDNTTVGPVVVRDGRVLIRWMPGAPDAALTPLPDYLAERVALALTPADPALNGSTSAFTEEHP